MAAMLREFKLKRIVAFSETDAAGLVHISNFREMRRTALVDRYFMRRVAGRTTQWVASGSMIIVFALPNPDGGLTATATPQTLADLIQEGPAKLLELEP